MSLFTLFVCTDRCFLLTPPPDVDTEDSEHSNQSYHSEKTLSERLGILTNQGLIQVVKVFVDWMRTNTDIILMCAQVQQPYSAVQCCILIGQRVFSFIFYNSSRKSQVYITYRRFYSNSRGMRNKTLRGVLRQENNSLRGFSLFCSLHEFFHNIIINSNV